MPSADAMRLRANVSPQLFPRAQVKGDVVIGEFCSTNEPDEIEISFTVTGDGVPQDTLKRAVTQLKPVILQRLEQYVAELNALPLQ